MSRQYRNLPLCFFALLLVLLLASCTTINVKHPLILDKTAKAESEFASVYFIRPRLFKSKGVADKPIRIEYQGQVLLTMDEGSYTLLKIKPSSGELKVFNETSFINQSKPIIVWRSRQYKFIEGKTYFIHLHRIDEEFRGIFYEPEPVKLQQAKLLIENARASGDASKAPIDKLTEVTEPPASATNKLSPALPENIYEQQPYFK